MTQHGFERFLVRPLPLRLVRSLSVEGLDALKIDLLLLAYGLAIRIDIRVPQNGKQPRFDICSRLKALKEPIGFEQRLLHQILRLARITRETQGRAIERVKMLQHHRFKFCLPASRLPGLGHTLFLQPAEEAAKRVKAISALRRTC